MLLLLAILIFPTSPSPILQLEILEDVKKIKEMVKDTTSILTTKSKN